MADNTWGRQPSLYPTPGMLKRPRTELDLAPQMVAPQMAPGLEVHDYLIRNDGRGGPVPTNDSKPISSAYDPFYQRSDVPPYNAAQASALSASSLGRGISVGDPSVLAGSGSMAQIGASNGRDVGYGARLVADAMSRPARETVPLPSDASNTLFVEGLPPNSSKREVAHIFRPFVGYKEVRLVTKESKRRGGDNLILCFVDFVDAACAATALSALQGYRMDEDDRDSKYLRIEFSRNPGPRAGAGSRGRH